MLFGVVLLNLALSLFPFQFGPAREFANDVQYLADGTMRTGVNNRAVTSGPPAWLAEAIEDQWLVADLVVRTLDPDQYGPARMLTVSNGPWDVDFAVAQLNDDIVVMVRRPGVDVTGEPAFVVPEVLGDRGWHDVLVELGETVTVTVDGQRRIHELLPVDSWASWGADHRLAVGNETYLDREWAGEIRRAEIRTSSGAVDYARQGTLVVPETYPYGFFRPWEPLTSPDSAQPHVVLVHALQFLPLGVALRGRRHPRLGHLGVGFVAAGFATLLQAAKMLVVFRHPAVADVVWLTMGAVVGSVLYSFASRAWAKVRTRDRY